MYMKLADKHDAFENIGSFVRSVEHHFHLFLWIDATKRVVHTTCAETKFVVLKLHSKIVRKKSTFNSA